MSEVFGGGMHLDCDDVYEWVDVRLWQWARWRSRGADVGIGFKHCAPFVGLLPPGGEIRDDLPLDIDERATETDQAVAALPADIRVAVVAVYTGRGTMQQRARDLRCCVRTLYARRGRGLALLAEVL